MTTLICIAYNLIQNYMESVNSNNKWTIGKYLRKQKRLRKADPNTKFAQVPPELNEYIDYLIQKGAKINKVKVGQFQLKNGLPYTGLVASEEIYSNETLVEIPENLLLTTKKAYFSELRKVFIENPKFFSKKYSSSWEDHMLLVFLIHEYKRGRDSEWYHLLQNLPKDLDYVIFWSDEELKNLEDETIFKISKKYRKEYEEEKAFILTLSNRYPDLIDPAYFTSENIQWIYTHLVTRCFGKYLEYVTMVPFAELFNHECSDVFYDLKYVEGNPHVLGASFDDKWKKLEPGEEDNFDTSDGSYNSSDEEFDSDYEYDFDLQDDIMKIDLKTEKYDDFGGDVQSRIRDIEYYISNQIDLGDSFSIFYFSQVMDKIKTLKNELNIGKITIQVANSIMKELEFINVLYANEIKIYYSEVLNKKKTDFLITQHDNLLKMNEPKQELDDIAAIDEVATIAMGELFNKDEDWKDDKFDYFVMKASWKDQFEKNSQVFFCYGRLSNRLMLLRYGMTLEWNKYEHIHFKIAYTNEFKDNHFILRKIKNFRLNKWNRFKLRRVSFNIDLINYCKATVWNFDKHSVESLLKPVNSDLELVGLNKAMEFLEKFLGEFKNTIEELENKLKDPNVFYHEYFAIVYKLERQRVVTFHLQAIKVLIEIIGRLKKGIAPEFSLSRVNNLENEQEYNRNRIFFKNYSKRLIKWYKK